MIVHPKFAIFETSGQYRITALKNPGFSPPGHYFSKKSLVIATQRDFEGTPEPRKHQMNLSLVRSSDELLSRSLVNERAVKFYGGVGL